MKTSGLSSYLQTATSYATQGVVSTLKFAGRTVMSIPAAIPQGTAGLVGSAWLRGQFYLHGPSLIYRGCMELTKRSFGPRLGYVLGLGIAPTVVGALTQPGALLATTVGFYAGAKVAKVALSVLSSMTTTKEAAKQEAKLEEKEDLSEGFYELTVSELDLSSLSHSENSAVAA